MLPHHRQLLVATRNAGKTRELANLLSGLPFKVRDLSEFPELLEIDETGSSFDENARLKARGYAIKTGLLSLADDSGLEVEALDGRPGIFSARYGGADTDFAEKMSILLREMEETGDADRRARFVSSMAIADSTGNIICTSEGICTGRIAAKPVGSRGFGYDPIFVPDGFDRTFGQLPDAVKQKISHRFRSFDQIILCLGDFTPI